jgi:signal transduction histidine kinase
MGEAMSPQVERSAPERDAALLSWLRRLAPYGVVTLDPLFRVQSWNNWMELHSGWRFEQVAGKSLFAIYEDLAARNLLSPFERALAGESSVLSTALHGYLVPLASPMAGAAGGLMRQTARIAPLFSDGLVCGIVVVIEDVTQRETQADALVRQHRRDEVLAWALAHFLKSEAPRKTIRQLFFKIAEHMDFDTFFLYLRDPGGEKLNLYAAGGIPVDSEGRFAEYSLLTRVAEAPVTVFFNGVQRRTEPEYEALKHARVAAAVAIPLFANGKSLGLLCFATWNREGIEPEESDLLATIAQYLASAIEREQTQEQLKQAQAQLVGQAQLLELKVRERTARLSETVAELETFNYTLAHDLKAPVRGMIGYCQILEKDFARLLPPDAALIVEKLARAPRKMERLIQNLLEFSRVSRQEIVLRVVEVEPIIEDILAVRLPSVRRAVTIQPPFPGVRAQRALLLQALANLVDNAVKFVEPGGEPKITISADFAPARSESARNGGLLFSSTRTDPGGVTAEVLEPASKWVRISVADEGIGIPAEAHPRIFGIFERGIVADAYEGTGMGLAIVARATQRMGGTCGVESEPGKGSRFWIELPAG